MEGKHITPAASELVGNLEKNVACSEPGCNKVFTTNSTLRFHLVKVHKKCEVKFLYTSIHSLYTVKKLPCVNSHDNTVRGSRSHRCTCMQMSEDDIHVGTVKHL